ncbi:MAG TPA: hypothetical protein VFC74_05505 [Oscillospiraceae bacterium]|nr:hypothetical protein [Oscillospiraceae bacterium]
MVFNGGKMELDSFELDESALAEAEKRREQKLTDDEQPVAAADDCEACKI